MKEVIKILSRDFYFDVLILLIFSLINFLAVSWFSKNYFLGLLGAFSFIINIGYWIYFTILVVNDSYLIPKGD